MTETVEKLKSLLGQLSPRERAELAHFLLASLHPEVDESVHVAWEIEVARRVDEIRLDQAAGKAADQLFAELREQYP